jgi:hypothetical protein
MKYLLIIEKNNNLLKRQAEFRQKLKFYRGAYEHSKRKINEEIKIQRYQSTLELKERLKFGGLNKLNQLQSFHIGAVENFRFVIHRCWQIQMWYYKM